MHEILKNGKKFYHVAYSNDILEKKGIEIQFDDDIDMNVAIIRYEGSLYCVSNICPHKHQAEIYNGIIKDCKVSCPLHGWTYDLKTGENINKKQGIKSLKSYQVFESDGYVYVEKPDLEIPKWRKQ